MKDHCNVLLLALSTFPYKLTMSENKFIWENGKEYTGIYQLDPVPKMLSDQLAQKGEWLDKIILLATTPTLEEEKDVVITYLDGRKDSYHGTAFNYFKSQIESHMNPNSNPEEKIVVVPIDEKKIEHGISDTIEKVREIENIRLYLDTHGGFREIFLVAEAVISLLKIDGIEVQGIYGIEYGEKKRIVDGRSGFHIFDFVSGMNEFINYGRIDSLEKFLKQNTGTDSKEKQQQKEIISCIKKISEGIQLCNIPAFEKGLNELTKYRQENICNSYLSIFVENIMSDYGILLDKKRTVIDEIKWCRKKGFYQQVLTLIESRVPKYLSCIGICKYHPKNKKDKTNVFNRCVPWNYNNGRGLSQEERMNKMKREGEWYPFLRKQYESNEKYEEDAESKVWVKFIISESKGVLLDEFLQMHVKLKSLRNISNHALDSKENKSLGDVDKQIESYLEKLELLALMKCEAKIKNVTPEGNVLLNIQDGIESMERKQCVLEGTSSDGNWEETWRINYSKEPDKVYEVEFIKMDGAQYWFKLI